MPRAHHLADAAGAGEMPASSCYHLCGTGLRLKASELQSTEGATYGQEQGTAFPASLFQTITAFARGSQSRSAVLIQCY